MRRHNGFSLIECLIAMALATTAMTVVAVTLIAVQRAHRGVRDRTVSEMQLHRFANQLRADTHRSVSVELEDGKGDILRLALSDRETIQYTLQAGRIQRDHRRNEDIVHHETYRLPDNCVTRWKLDESGSAAMVSFQLDPEPVEQSGRVGGRSEEIKAAVGLLKQPTAQAKS